MPDIHPPAAPALGPEERALLRRLPIELALSAAGLVGWAFHLSPRSGLAALAAAAVVTLNFYLMAAMLHAAILGTGGLSALRGVLSFAGRLLLIGMSVFAIIRGLRLDSNGVVLGCLTVVAAIFLEVFYLLGREIRQRCITNPH